MSEKTRRVALSGLLTALMLILGYVENMIPITAAVPGIKLGLSNSVLLYALYMMGPVQTLILMVVKVILSGFMFGGVFAMLYSFAGGLLSVLAMMAFKRIKGVSTIGVSVMGAVFHNVGQVLVAVWVTKAVALLTTYLPMVLLLSGVVTGILTGLIAQMVMKHLKHMPAGR